MASDEDLTLPIAISVEEKAELNKLFPSVRKEDVLTDGITIETASARLERAVDNLVNGDGVRAWVSSHGDKPSIELFIRHSF